MQQKEIKRGDRLEGRGGRKDGGEREREIVSGISRSS